ncbi:hypothetical protein ABGB18_19475 [Nonomuraea sp. B12E4]|uniref:hypothetical protein n=1 Tax=Nonomuraea sp. B12E4 TaxID=3153564 RepID=UPI00325E130F
MAHTHALSFAGSVVTKRYVSWDRGEQHREWAVLRHLHRYAAGLAPRPLASDLDAAPPSVTMTVLPGRPLAGAPTAPQLDALATAVTALWAVPCDGLPDVCRWREDLRFAGRLTALPRPAGGPTAVASDAALAWWDGPDPALLRTEPEVRALLGRGSGGASVDPP